MRRRIIITLCLLGALGLCDVWVNKNNPLDRFTSKYYAYGSASPAVVPIGPTVLLCIVIGVLTMPTPRQASVRTMLRYAVVILLTVGAVESLVLGSISYPWRTIELVPLTHSGLWTDSSILEVSFDSGSLDCNCYFCARSQIAKAKFVISPKHWAGFGAWCTGSPMRHSRFWTCSPDQAHFGVHLAAPAWFLVAVLSPYPGIIFVRWWRRRRRAKRGQCLECGYNLTANVSGVCPECGAAAPPTASSN
jgi:hypothetical protein